MKKNLKAFTLSETLIVVVVLGIIATLTIPALVNKNKESVAKTKVRKAMAAYESALNKMIIENDLKSHETLTAWAGDADSGCANSSNYFKKVQDVNGCKFKTSDGIWWDISNIERPIIAFNQDNLTIAKANAENDMSAFVLVGRFGTDGSLRVDDLAYETGNGHADQNSDKQVTKLYTFLGMKKSTAGGGQTQSCDEGDIVCKYRRGDTLPACSGEEKSCVIYKMDCEHDKECPEGYFVFDNNGNAVIFYTKGTDNNGNEFIDDERIYDGDMYTLGAAEGGAHENRTTWTISSNGNIYKSFESSYNEETNIQTTAHYRESAEGKIYKIMEMQTTYVYPRDEVLSIIAYHSDGSVCDNQQWWNCD